MPKRNYAHIMPKRKNTEEKSCSEDIKIVRLEDDDFYMPMADDDLDGPSAKYELNIGETTRKRDVQHHLKLEKFYKDAVF